MTLDVIGQKVFAVFVIAGEILSRLANLSQIVSNISTFLANLQLPTFISDTGTTLSSISSNLNSIGIAQNEQFKALQAQINALSGQVGLPMQQGIPVRLPPTPPSGYGGASSSATAAAVWEYPIPAAADDAAGDLLAGAGLMALGLSNAAAEFRLGLEPGWLVRGGWANQTSGPHDQPDTFDVSLILPTDTSVTGFLNRLNPGTYTADHLGRATVAATNPAEDWVYVTQWGQLEFDEWKLSAFGGSAVTVPPVWPGLSGVTLGTPVALSSSFEIVGPLHGVLVEMTAVNPKKATADIHGSITHRRIGTLVFVTDNGDAERFQPLDFMHRVYLPQTMKVAARVRFDCDVDDVGTATPFTIP